MLLYAAAVLVGIGTTQRVGEERPAFVAAADIRRSIVQAEGWLTTAGKIETGDGWATRLGADFWSGPISLGAHWAHRETSQWRKGRLFVRVSTQHGPLRLIGEFAPDSSNEEIKAEARLRLAVPAWSSHVLYCDLPKSLSAQIAVEPLTLDELARKYGQEEGR